jgi:sodium-dependent dicarboxylate transporter 2/3/5
MYKTRQKIGFFLGPALFVALVVMSPPEGMSVQAQRVAATAVLMATWWITEAIPIPATSLLPVALFPTLGVLGSAEACAPYANHLIFLFLGGFFIAIAMEKWNLHRRIALRTILLVGTSPKRIILGFMVATAFLSMWISNTATAMMMVPIALAVVTQTGDFLRADKTSSIDVTPGHFKFGAALMLAIAYSASIGGVTTIIGTPPNTILVGLVEKMYGQQIGFASWMTLGAPLSLIMLLFTWLYLVKIALPPEIHVLPGGRTFIREELRRLGPISQAELRILVVFTLVAAAWIIRGFIHIGSQMMHDATIAIIGAIALFIIPADFKKGRFLLDWQAAAKVPWDVIILFGGGLSLANAFTVSGLAQWIGGRLTLLQGVAFPVLLAIVILLAIFLTEVTSNTATAAMLIPIMGSIALAMKVHPFSLMIGAAIASSYAFMLPVATPPNAIVFGTRYITIPQMARVGFVLNIVSTVFITLLILWLLPLLWGIDLQHLPDWVGAITQ